MIDDTTADEIRASNAHTRRANERARQAGIPPVFFRGRRVWSEARVARPLECPGFGGSQRSRTSRPARRWS